MYDIVGVVVTPLQSLQERDRRVWEDDGEEVRRGGGVAATGRRSWLVGESQKIEKCSYGGFVVVAESTKERRDSNFRLLQLFFEFVLLEWLTQ